MTYVGCAKTYSFDLSAWAEDNHNVTSVTWSVEAGNAEVSVQALTSNVASALITMAEAGESLIKITALTGTETLVAYLDILTKDPQIVTNCDYGMVS